MRRCAADFCDAHYQRLRIWGDLRADIPIGHCKKRDGPRDCSVPGCLRPGGRKGFCDAHYLRLRKWGDVRADIPIAKRSR
jgi:hypothetical protein